MTGHPGLFRAFGAPAFVRAHLDLRTAQSGPEVLDLVRDLSPDLAILEQAPPELEGFALCEAIKNDPATKATRVLLVLGAVPRAELFARLVSCGCDGTLSWPVDPEELYQHLAELLSLPAPRSRRQRVSLEVTLQSAETQVPADVQDVSHGGMCVVARTALEPGARVGLRLEDAAGPLGLNATVVWARPEDDGLVRLGLELRGMSPEARARIADLALWEASAGSADGVVRVSVHGRLDEGASFVSLQARLAGVRAVELDLSAVDQINSAGVRNWYNFVHALAECELVFRRCSVPFTLQMCMMPGLTRGGRVASVLAPYACDRCGDEAERLLEVATLRAGEAARAPSFPCTCGGRLALDDQPERYFAFLSG